jgi:hypothetical protein
MSGEIIASIKHPNTFLVLFQSILNFTTQKTGAFLERNDSITTPISSSFHISLLMLPLYESRII